VQIRVVIPRSGEVTVETISILEDLWHDYLFFRSQAAAIEQPEVTADGRLVAKRYRRAALLMLVFYLEGVVNRWLQHLLKEADWPAWEKMPLTMKAKRIEAAINVDASLGIDKAKSIRNALAHLKPGGDFKLFDSVTDDLLAEVEASVVQGGRGATLLNIEEAR
jgi:hypothetical protein